ncbi:uncharacterized protein P174DRAFT_177967 [Aspergillus novofumigatus IBT 16806]|uniref:Uncharacterized protein n=1 Tax=Aspergillus novofumigatus (strain IBT 16806) TaxID=1392255 RepID=A0A2I1C9K5_ASPN1|nr:uncharacterized protein P174DRAFT_177967 [Aspergillus novofumigatus IBT 16806]PKX94285.1 hypothetical protein P174DRAFT_177967 [Aspergillus novofumigatus IBT 16806]
MEHRKPRESSCKPPVSENPRLRFREDLHLLIGLLGIGILVPYSGNQRAGGAPHVLCLRRSGEHWDSRYPFIRLSRECRIDRQAVKTDQIYSAQHQSSI